MAAPPEVWGSALDDALGDGALHAAACQRQGEAVPVPDGNQLGHHSAFGHDGDTARLQPYHGSGVERPRQDREGRGLDRRRTELETGAAQSTGAAEGADKV